MKRIWILWVLIGLTAIFAGELFAEPTMTPVQARDDWMPDRIYKNYAAAWIVDTNDPNERGVALCSREKNKDDDEDKGDDGYEYHEGWDGWLNGGSHEFTFSFTRETGTVVFEINNGPSITADYTEYVGVGVDEVFITTTSTDDEWSYAYVKGLLVNGQDYDFEPIDGYGKYYAYSSISGLGCDDFVITGKVHCSWLGKQVNRYQFIIRLGEGCDPNSGGGEPPEPPEPEFDFDGDCATGIGELAMLAEHWLDTCSDPNWCGGVDFDFSTNVDFADFAFLAGHWGDKFYGGGCGTEEYPYLIYTAEQLDSVGINPDDWGSHFKLMNDISLALYTGNTFNTMGDSITPFTGVFDGGGYEISYFTQDDDDTEVTGLFRYVNSPDAVVKNIRLVNPLVVTKGPHYAGALVGLLTNGLVSNCHVIGGEVTGYKGYAETIGANFVGGLVGFNDGTITGCSASTDVSGYNHAGGLVGWNEGAIEKSFATGVTISGHDKVGGLVGNNYQGAILDSYAQKDVFAHDQVGGLVGESDSGTIENCYSTGHVTENSDDRGGLIGLLFGNVTSSFWDYITGGGIYNDNGIGIPKVTLEMQTESTFTDEGWDFITPIWSVYEYIDYPVLWWQVVPRPDPMVWDLEPETLGAYSIGMTATVARAWDANEVDNFVEYYFCNVTDPNHDSGWQESLEYIDTALVPEMEYTYKVKARDLTMNLNENQYSVEASATTLSDIDSPGDGTVDWFIPPYATGPFSISMVVRTVYDDGGVEYYFACITDPNHDSGWQENPIYENTGLDDLTEYAYRVIARDKSVNLNETDWSTEESAYRRRRS